MSVFDIALAHLSVNTLLLNDVPTGALEKAEHIELQLHLAAIASKILFQEWRVWRRLSAYLSRSNSPFSDITHLEPPITAAVRSKRG